MGIMQAYGPQNPLVGLTEIRNTLADLLFTAGVRNADRYYRPMNQQIEQQLAQQAAQAAAQQPPQSDPQSAAFLQAEQMKVSARVQADMQRNQIEAMKAQMADDRERDRMAQDLYLRAAEIEAKSGVAVQTAQIKAEQAAPRMPGAM
jgi:signal transduction histidine kinase